MLPSGSDCFGPGDFLQWAMKPGSPLRWPQVFPVRFAWPSSARASVPLATRSDPRQTPRMTDKGRKALDREWRCCVCQCSTKAGTCLARKHHRPGQGPSTSPRHDWTGSSGPMSHGRSADGALSWQGELDLSRRFRHLSCFSLRFLVRKETLQHLLQRRMKAGFDSKIYCGLLNRVPPRCKPVACKPESEDIGGRPMSWQPSTPLFCALFRMRAAIRWTEVWGLAAGKSIGSRTRPTSKANTRPFYALRIEHPQRRQIMRRLEQAIASFEGCDSRRGLRTIEASKKTTGRRRFPTS